MATYKPKKKIDKNGTLEEVKIPIESVDGLESNLNTTKNLIQDLDEKVAKNNLDASTFILDDDATEIIGESANGGIKYRSFHAIENSDGENITPIGFKSENILPIVADSGINIDTSDGVNIKISTDLPTVKAKLTPASEVGGGSGGGISGVWTSGTSGSVTLPSAGLYEVKSTTAFGLVHVTLYWNGSGASLSSFGAIAGLPAIIVSGTGVITTVDSNDLSTPIELTLEYRKIGEA